MISRQSIYNLKPLHLGRFIWLRQFEVGNNSADANRLSDRLEFLQGLSLPSDLYDGLPPHRITRLRRQGERYFTDGLKDITGDRRLPLLAVRAVEWKAAIADAIVETHDRIVRKTWREAGKPTLAKVRILSTPARSGGGASPDRPDKA